MNTLQNLVDFPPFVTTSQKARYLWMVKEQMEYYKRILGNDKIFDNLKKITLVNSKDPLEDHHIGEEWQGNVNAYFNDDPSIDSYVTTHELAHYVMEFFFPTGNERNDVVHYAANDSTSKYRTYSTRRYYGTFREWISKRKSYLYNIEFFLIDKMIIDTPEIMASIEKGTAPKGPNIYWTANPLSK